MAGVWMIFMLFVLAYWALWLNDPRELARKDSSSRAKVSLRIVIAIGVVSMAICLLIQVVYS